MEAIFLTTIRNEEDLKKETPKKEIENKEEEENLNLFSLPIGV